MTDEHVDVAGRTVDDVETFEREQLARDCDRHDDVLEFSDSYAREIVPAAQQYVHIASGERFESVLALAYFQEGWEARDDVDL